MLLNSNDESKIVSQAESIDYKNFFGQDYKTLTTSETKDIEKKLLAAKNISNKCKSTNDSKISYPGSNVIFDSIFYKSKKTGQYHLLIDGDENKTAQNIAILINYAYDACDNIVANITSLDKRIKQLLNDPDFEMFKDLFNRALTLRNLNATPSKIPSDVTSEINPGATKKSEPQKKNVPDLGSNDSRSKVQIPSVDAGSLENQTQDSNNKKSSNLNPSKTISSDKTIQKTSETQDSTVQNDSSKESSNLQVAKAKQDNLSKQQTQNINEAEATDLQDVEQNTAQSKEPLKKSNVSESNSQSSNSMFNQDEAQSSTKVTNSSSVEVQQIDPIAQSFLLYQNLRLTDIVYSGFVLEDFLKTYCGLNIDEINAVVTHISQVSIGLSNEQIAKLDLKNIFNELSLDLSVDWYSLKLKVASDLSSTVAVLTDPNDVFKYSKIIADSILHFSKDGNFSILNSTNKRDGEIELQVQSILLSALSATANSSQARKWFFDYLQDALIESAGSKDAKYLRLGVQTCWLFSLEEYAYNLQVSLGKNVQPPSHITRKTSQQAQSWLEDNSYLLEFKLSDFGENQEFTQYSDLKQRAIDALSTIVSNGSASDSASASFLLSSLSNLNEDERLNLSSLITNKIPVSVYSTGDMRNLSDSFVAVRLLESLINIGFFENLPSDPAQKEAFLNKITSNFALLSSGYIFALGMQDYIKIADPSSNSGVQLSKQDMNVADWFLENMYNYCEKQLSDSPDEFKLQKRDYLQIIDNSSNIQTASEFEYVLHILNKSYEALCKNERTRYNRDSNEFIFGELARQYYDMLKWY